MIVSKKSLNWEKLKSWGMVTTEGKHTLTKQGVPCVITFYTYANNVQLKGKAPLGIFTDQFLIEWQADSHTPIDKRWHIREELRNRGYFVDVRRGRGAVPKIYKPA